MSIGTATQDVFLSGEIFTPLCESGICFEHLKLGDKLYVDDAVFSSGGNATNAATTFARQGIDSSFVGVIGNDPSGKAVLDELKDNKVDTTNVTIEDSFKTSYSVILLAPSGERTILRVRGGDAINYKADFLKNIEADWVYVSSLGSIELLTEVVDKAFKNGAKIAFNPGTLELEHPKVLKKMMSKISILAANKDEAKTLFNGETMQDLAKEAGKVVDFAIITDGPKGEAASDGQHVCTGGMYEDVEVLDRTGAGDAFASGFTASIAQGKNMEEAITFASANSTSVVQFIGAKQGILHKDAKLHSMQITCS